VRRRRADGGPPFDFIFMDYIMVSLDMYGHWVCYGWIDYTSHSHSQIQMNGPEAAQIMYKELKFEGVIIGVHDFCAQFNR
jgi:hypothetical protein